MADDEIDDVLAGQLAALRGGGRAASSAVRWSAKRLRTETAADQVRIDPADAEVALRRVADLFYEEPEAQGGSLSLRGTVGSGFGGLNPAYVVVELDPSGMVSVAAYAKEGLIKQRTAAKAVRQVLDAVTDPVT